MKGLMAEGIRICSTQVLCISTYPP